MYPSVLLDSGRILQLANAATKIARAATALQNTNAFHATPTSTLMTLSASGNAA